MHVRNDLLDALDQLLSVLRLLVGAIHLFAYVPLLWVQWLLAAQHIQIKGLLAKIDRIDVDSLHWLENLLKDDCEAADLGRAVQAIGSFLYDLHTVDGCQLITDEVLRPLEQFVRMREHDFVGGGDAPALDLVD